MRRIARRLLVAAALVVLALAAASGIGWVLTSPEPLPVGSESRSRLEPGPVVVGVVERVWVDRSRPTPAQGDFPGVPYRTLPVAIWYPEGGGGTHPLLVFVHGLMSSRFGCRYLAEHLASRGYVVVSADYPSTHVKAPGGPDYRDVVQQPADVSFLIDRALALEPSERPFPGELDPARIGVFGISLGGATATLTAFHPRWRDSRVAAAVSIAGPGDVFGPRFFSHADVPFLMIAGTSDAVVDYAINATPLPRRIAAGGLLTIDGATHAGFTDVTSGWLRLLGNPDALGCRGAPEGAIPQDRSVFVGLFGTQAEGLVVPERYRPPCGASFDDAMRAGRQQDITRVAVTAFFESLFASSGDERRAQARFLERTLPAELAEVRYTPARRADPVSGEEGEAR